MATGISQPLRKRGRSYSRHPPSVHGLLTSCNFTDTGRTIMWQTKQQRDREDFAKYPRLDSIGQRTGHDDRRQHVEVGRHDRLSRKSGTSSSRDKTEGVKKSSNRVEQCWSNKQREESHTPQGRRRSIPLSRTWSCTRVRERGRSSTSKRSSLPGPSILKRRSATHDGRGCKRVSISSVDQVKEFSPWTEEERDETGHTRQERDEVGHSKRDEMSGMKTSRQDGERGKGDRKKIDTRLVKQQPGPTVSHNGDVGTKQGLVVVHLHSSGEMSGPKQEEQKMCIDGEDSDDEETTEEDTDDEETTEEDTDDEETSKEDIADKKTSEVAFDDENNVGMVFSAQPIGSSVEDSDEEETSKGDFDNEETSKKDFDDENNVGMESDDQPIGSLDKAAQKEKGLEENDLNNNENVRVADVEVITDGAKGQDDFHGFDPPLINRSPVLQVADVYETLVEQLEYESPVGDLEVLFSHDYQSRLIECKHTDCPTTSLPSTLGLLPLPTSGQYWSCPQHSHCLLCKDPPSSSPSVMCTMCARMYHIHHLDEDMFSEDKLEMELYICKLCTDPDQFIQPSKEDVDPNQVVTDYQDEGGNLVMSRSSLTCLKPTNAVPNKQANEGKILKSLTRQQDLQVVEGPKSSSSGQTKHLHGQVNTNERSLLEDDPTLPRGWYRQLVWSGERRKVVIFAPDGRKFWSKRDLKKAHWGEGDEDFNWDEFDFSLFGSKGQQ
eukprot:GFUD01025272.1.p1 GENE.GFUD01025272.1~~GFUD01025272.1.p1  ORF type:complete len:720 (+),score=193.26 GFUD01025272.1:64-2223(+)